MRKYLSCLYFADVVSTKVFVEHHKTLLCHYEFQKDDENGFVYRQSIYMIDTNNTQAFLKGIFAFCHLIHTIVSLFLSCLLVMHHQPLYVILSQHDRRRQQYCNSIRSQYCYHSKILSQYVFLI